MTKKISRREIVKKTAIAGSAIAYLQTVPVIQAKETGNEMGSVQLVEAVVEHAGVPDDVTRITTDGMPNYVVDKKDNIISLKPEINKPNKDSLVSHNKITSINETPQNQRKVKNITVNSNYTQAVQEKVRVEELYRPPSIDIKSVEGQTVAVRAENKEWEVGPERETVVELETRDVGLFNGYEADPINSELTPKARIRNHGELSMIEFSEVK